MAVKFSGTNESLYNSNGVAGINVDAFTIAVRVKIDTEPSGTNIICLTASEVTGGNSAFSLNAVSPDVAGWVIQCFYRFDTFPGRWEHQTDLNVAQWYGVVIKYDRSLASNNPRIWIDGSEVTLTRTSTPVGAVKTGVDSIIYGEDVGFNNDLDGKLAEAAFWAENLPDSYCEALSASHTPAFWPYNLKLHSPFFAKQDERQQAITYTERGTVDVVDHPGGLIYPSQPLVYPAAVAPPAVGNPWYYYQQQNALIG